jgi:hypothetical protein
MSSFSAGAIGYVARSLEVLVVAEGTCWSLSENSTAWVPRTRDRSRRDVKPTARFAASPAGFSEHACAAGRLLHPLNVEAAGRIGC